MTSDKVRPDSEPKASEKRPSIKLIVSAVVICLIASLASFAAGALIKSPQQKLSEVAPPRHAPVTATVTSRIVSTTQTFSAKFERAHRVSIPPPPSEGNAASVVTRAPAAKGSALRAGEVVAEVNGRPVFVLQGEIPAYRSLAPSDSGPDVTQLRGSLCTLGYLKPDRCQGDFDGELSDALRRLYKDRGYAPPVVGVEDLEAARNQLKSAKLAYQKLAQSEDRPALDDAKAAIAQAQSSVQSAQKRSGVRLPMGEIAFIPDSSATVTTVLPLGAKVTQAVAVLETGGVVAVAQLSGAETKGLEPGQPVELRLFDGSVAAATVARIDLSGTSQEGTPGQLPANGLSAPTGSSVVMSPSEPIDVKKLGSSVRAAVTTATSKEPVLAVPATAIITGADGDSFVRVIQGQSEKQLKVEVGRTGDGWAEVSTSSSEGLKPGAEVAVSSRDLPRDESRED